MATLWHFMARPRMPRMPRMPRAVQTEPSSTLLKGTLARCAYRCGNSRCELMAFNSCALESHGKGAFLDGKSMMKSQSFSVNHDNST